METPNFYAIIPSEVRYSDLKPNAKLLYWEITALTNKEWFCWASNEYFAKLYWVNISTISRWISQLNERWFIRVSFVNQDLSKRKIFIWEMKTVKTKTAKAFDEKDKSLWQKEHKAYDKKSKHNNTKIILQDNNNISNDILLQKDLSFWKNLEEIIKKEFDENFIKEVYKKYSLSKENFIEECSSFLYYWKEKNTWWTKERWQKEKTFDPKLRFITRMRNSKKWSEKKIVFINQEDEERKKKIEELDRRKKELFNSF